LYLAFTVKQYEYFLLAAGLAFEASSRYRTVETLAQAAQMLAGPVVVFPDPNPDMDLEQPVLQESDEES
jgi:hypothetical protein